MRCRCGGKLLVSHSYDAGDHGATGRAACVACGKVVTVVHFIAEEEPSHGKGAAATATKIRRGRLRPSLQERIDED